MNEKVKRFVEKYCEKHGISEEEAKKHLIVKQYQKMLEEQANERENP